MPHDERKVYILRVWLERTRTGGEPVWRASLSDDADPSTPRYFASLTDLLAHLRRTLEGGP